jgi:glycosyltransferase involved in cell wall biosynthesis
MKIAFFTNSYFPICYGSVISIESFRKNLEKLGHQVYVFAPSYDDYKDKNNRVFRYPAFLFKYKIDYPISIPVSSFINKKIKELDLDIIHVHQPFSLGKEGLRYARKLKIPIIFTYHTKYEDYVHYVPFFPEKILAELVKKEAINFSNKCDLTIAPSVGIKKIIEKRGANKKSIKVLPTGINWDDFQKGAREKVRKKYLIKKNEILLTNIGRINEEKNLVFLLESFKKIALKNPKIKLMFIGEGFLKEELKEKAKKWGIEKQVIFTGFLKNTEIKNYLKATDIYLQTSLSETQGITILEAMASSLPIVAVKATGTEDFIVNKKNGFLTKNNQKDFIEKIEYLIKHPSKRREFGKQAQKDAKKYQEINQAKKLEKVYLDLVD